MNDCWHWSKHQTNDILYIYVCKKWFTYKMCEMIIQRMSVCVRMWVLMPPKCDVSVFVYEYIKTPKHVSLWSCGDVKHTSLVWHGTLNTVRVQSTCNCGCIACNERMNEWTRLILSTQQREERKFSIESSSLDVETVSEAGGWPFKPFIEVTMVMVYIMQQKPIDPPRSRNNTRPFSFRRRIVS